MNLNSKAIDKLTLLALSKSAVTTSTKTLTLIKLQPNSFDFVQLPIYVRRESNKANMCGLQRTSQNHKPDDLIADHASK